LIYGINYGKDELSTSNDIPYNTVRALSLLTSIIVVIVNAILTGVVRHLSVKEKHETYTSYNLSVAFKLTIARFVNTSIVPIIVSMSNGAWFVDGGLVSIIFYIMISLAFLEIFIYLFDGTYLW
jgi:Na+-transporting NADH:ubiquinone oxidoreductase subunit NqrE